ncbi:MAG TPA: two-component regulator propeller domain-containing protein, partial [Mariniphaga sp.]|nr:two-component regulator propeller domain-containing protein [Mariniphaga sp.]
MFRSISVEDGLSNNFVTAINQDSGGYVWFGTLDGLDRYDGLEIRSFANKFPSRPVKVNRIINDPEQGIWIGTDLGLFYWDFISEKFQEIQLSDESIPVTTLLFLQGDSLLVTGTTKGLWLHNIRTSETTPIKLQDISSETIQVTDALLNESDLWVTTTSGLLKVTLPGYEVETFRNEQSSLAYNNFSSLAAHNDTIFLGTQTRGLFIFEPSKQAFSTFTDIGNRSILVIKHDPAGNLYIGTDGGGLTIMDLKDYSYHTYREEVGFPYSLNSNAVYSMHIDRHGRFWIGTYSGGINYNTAHKGGFKVSVAENDLFLGQSSIRSMYFDDNNDKYIGT